MLARSELFIKTALCDYVDINIFFALMRPAFRAMMLTRRRMCRALSADLRHARCR